MELMVSLDFDPSKTGIIDGINLGIGYQVNANVALVASYGLKRGRKLRPSFRSKAASMVDSLKKDPTHAALFSRFQSGADLKDTKQFDGFPLRDPRNGNLIDVADPFLRSYNSSINVGIIFARTIDLTRIFPPE